MHRLSFQCLVICLAFLVTLEPALSHPSAAATTSATGHAPGFYQNARMSRFSTETLSIAALPFGRRSFTPKAHSLIIAMLPLCLLAPGQTLEKIQPSVTVRFSEVDKNMAFRAPRLTERGMQVITNTEATIHQRGMLKTALETVRVYADKSPLAPEGLQAMLADETIGVLIVIDKPVKIAMEMGQMWSPGALGDALTTLFSFHSNNKRSLEAVAVAVDPDAFVSRAKLLAAVGHEVIGHVARAGTKGEFIATQAGVSRAQGEKPAFDRSVAFLEWVGSQQGALPFLTAADMKEIKGPVLAREKELRQTAEQALLAQSKGESRRSLISAALFVALAALFLGALFWYPHWRRAKSRVSAAYDQTTGSPGSFLKLPASTRKGLVLQFIRRGPVAPDPNAVRTPLTSSQLRTYASHLKQPGSLLVFISVVIGLTGSSLPAEVHLRNTSFLQAAA